MTWMHVIIAVGYLLALLAIVVLWHGATQVYRELHERRQAEHNSNDAHHVA